MTERCPKCGIKLGFRGPKQKTEIINKLNDKKIRFFCRSCSVELFQNHHKLERLFSFIGWGGLFIASIDLIFQHLQYDVIPKKIGLIIYAVAIIGLGGLIWLLLTNQHYRLEDASKPPDSEDTEEPVAD